MFTSVVVVVVVVVVAAAAAILAIIIIIKWCVLSEQCDYIYTNIISFPIKHHSLTSMEASLCLYTCPSQTDMYRDRVMLPSDRLSISTLPYCLHTKSAGTVTCYIVMLLRMMTLEGRHF